MEYVKLLVGIVMIVVFTWILVRNSKRTGWMDALLRLDNLLIVAIGAYMVVTSARMLVL